MNQEKPFAIGIAGYAGAGKDHFANLLKYELTESGRTCALVSSGDLIRGYVKEKNLGDIGDRAVLRKTVDDVAKDYGYTFWLDRALAQSADVEIMLYPGLRQAVEVETIKDRGGAIIGIDVPLEVRYKRAQLRARAGDDISFEQFKANEEAERAGTAQQIDAVLSSITTRIVNDGTLEQLELIAKAIADDLPNLKSEYIGSQM